MEFVGCKQGLVEVSKVGGRNVGGKLELYMGEIAERNFFVNGGG